VLLCSEMGRTTRAGWRWRGDRADAHRGRGVRDMSESGRWVGSEGEGKILRKGGREGPSLYCFTEFVAFRTRSVN
jgi:hypothetical protein